jgi:putative RNA 2'-phosphotransferase
VNDVRLSRVLSRVLRHAPSSVGVALDSAGWVSVDDLLVALNRHGHRTDRVQLERVVATSDKQRFALDPRTGRIRANQGHSVAVDLDLPAAVPPDRLFHGTPSQNLDSIAARGLVPGSRHAVHLSADEQTAHRVGARRGEHVVLLVDASRMHRDGFVFTVSDNGVWLVDRVPPRYLDVR